jgi:hypothetical protein
VAVPIPGEDLGQRPPAEPAVIVEEDHRAFHAHRVDEPRDLVRDPVCSSTRKRSEDQVLFLEAPLCPTVLGKRTLVPPRSLSASHRGSANKRPLHGIDLRKCRQNPWQVAEMDSLPSSESRACADGTRPALANRVLTLECAPRRTLAT